MASSGRNVEDLIRSTHKSVIRKDGLVFIGDDAFVVQPAEEIGQNLIAVRDQWPAGSRAAFVEKTIHIRWGNVPFEQRNVVRRLREDPETLIREITLEIEKPSSSGSLS